MNVVLNLLFILYSIFFLQDAYCSTINSLTPPLVVYHRAGMLNGGGNTLENIKESISSSADIIEMDLRSTSDGVPVLFHDPSLENSTYCKGTIESQKWENIKECLYKNNKRKIALFEDVIQIAIPHKVLDVEFKNIKAIEPAIKLVNKYSAAENIYFQVKNDQSAYKFVREKKPNLRLLYKVETIEDLNWALSLNDPYLIFIELDPSMANRNVINQILFHNKWIRANAWLFDPTKELFTAGCKKLFQWGISAAHTNRAESCYKQKKFYKPL